MRSPLQEPVRAPRSLADLTFMLVVGLAGWALLAVAEWTGAAPTTPGSGGAVPFLLFLAVTVAARPMAFELLPRTVVTADAAFYVAGALCLGPVPAGWLVAITLTVDSLIRLRRVGRAEADAPRGRVRSLAYVLYFGGMTGALLAGVAWLMGAGAELEVSSHAVLAGKVFGIGATFLVAHYAIQGFRQFLAGRPLRVYVRSFAGPIMLAEVSLLPLAVVVVLVFRPAQPLGFVLLGATFLIINFILNRLSRARDKLRKRVAELETLNATARGLSRSLETRKLIQSVAREVVRAVPGVDSLELSLYDTADGGFAVDSYDRVSGSLTRARADALPAAVRHVLESERPLVCFDERGRSFLGVPLVMYGGVEGVLSIEGDRDVAFGIEQRQLLESVSSQVAVALQNARLYELAMVDGLTGLFVRRYFDARLDEEIKRADRFGTIFSVVMIDIDDFKQLNDTYGHVVGDRALRAVAEIVRNQMRGVDTAARYGGEEISLILPRTEMVDAYNQAERIRRQVAELALELSPGEGEGGPVGLTASFGIAAYPDCGAEGAVDLVRRADRALYRAKKTGKDRVELFWNDSGESPGKSSLRTV
jgi:diguanylate cyclase (GGDEF)-like protein